MVLRMKGLKALRTRCVVKDPPTRKSRHQGLQKKKRRSFLTTHAMLLTLLFLGLIVLWSPLDASPFAQKSARRFFGDAVYADYFSFCLSYDWVFHSESGRGSLKWWLMETGGKTGSWRPGEDWVFHNDSGHGPLKRCLMETEGSLTCSFDKPTRVVGLELALSRPQHSAFISFYCELGTFFRIF